MVTRQNGKKNDTPKPDESASSKSQEPLKAAETPAEAPPAAEDGAVVEGVPGLSPWETKALAAAADSPAKPKEEPAKPKGESPVKPMVEPAKAKEEPAVKATKDGPRPPPEHADPPPRPSPPPRPPETKRPEKRSGGFFGMVLGGLIAAGIGYGAATYFPLPGQGGIPPELQAALDNQTARLAKAESDLQALRETVGGEVQQLGTQIGALNDSVAPLAGATSALDERLGGLDSRLTEIEKRPVDGGAASASALEAFERDIAALRATMDGQNAEIAAAKEEVAAATAEVQRLGAEAAEAAHAAAARAALASVNSALDSGTAFTAGLDALRSAAVDVPQPLVDQAGGVPTITALREAFPPAARAALEVSLQGAEGSGTWDRLGAFLRSQTSARSLTPQEGGDPDAVLSRAEAALKSGDLQAAVDEIAALPPEGQSAMAGWVDLAKRRIAAVDAAAGIAEEIK